VFDIQDFLAATPNSLMSQINSMFLLSSNECNLGSITVTGRKKYKRSSMHTKKQEAHWYNLQNNLQQAGLMNHLNDRFDDKNGLGVRIRTLKRNTELCSMGRLLIDQQTLGKI